jgi:GDPmannose 4,6-dehydratase
MHSALVTGITGPDGGSLAERMLDAGYMVHGLVRPGMSSRSTSVSCGSTGDLAYGSRLAELVVVLRPDVIVNLGGLS